MKALFLKVAARANAVPDAAEHIARFCAVVGLDRQDCFEIKVVIAEVLNNVAAHGRVDEARGAIEIHCRHSDTCLELIVNDRGRPLDRLPSDGFPRAGAKSGRGWPIIIHWTDSLEYRPGPPFNTLILTKALC